MENADGTDRGATLRAMEGASRHALSMAINKELLKERLRRFALCALTCVNLARLHWGSFCFT